MKKLICKLFGIVPEQPWISVNDRLPEPDETVIVHCTHFTAHEADPCYLYDPIVERSYVVEGYYWPEDISSVDTGWNIILRNDDGYSRNARVTHWKPLIYPELT